MQSVITNVRRNDLAEPIKRVALERNKNQSTNQPLFSIYRDILFLAFTVLGRGNIDQGMLIFVKLKFLICRARCVYLTIFVCFRCF